MWRIISATLRYRWLLIALAWGAGVFAGLQLGLPTPAKLAITIAFFLVVASAIAGTMITDLERRERRGLLLPLLVVGRRQVAAARAVAPVALLALGAALGTCYCILDALFRGQVVEPDSVLAPVAAAAQLLPYMQLALIAVEVKAAHDEARRGGARLGALLFITGLAMPLAINLGSLVERWVACALALGVGLALTVAAGVLYRRRLRFTE
jgi:hypothetical protein